MSNTTIAMEAPPGSDSAEASAIFQDTFPSRASSVPVVVVLQRQGGYAVIGDDMRLYTHRLLNATTAYKNGAYVHPNNFISYYTLLDQKLGPIAKKLVRNDTTLIVVYADVPGGLSLSSEGKDFVDFVDDTIHRLAQETFNDSMRVWLTGSLVFERDVETGIEHDLLITDGIALPIALLILALVLRSLRLLILPVICIAVSILTSFALVYPISLSTTTVSFTPSLMMSATLAMSIDYSLFLLSRYREELLACNSIYMAIAIMLKTSGRTVLLSGLTLALCFAGLAFFRVSVLSIPGLATAIAIINAVVVNLSLTPALLFAFPEFFAKCVNTQLSGRQSITSVEDPASPLLDGIKQVIYIYIYIYGCIYGCMVVCMYVCIFVCEYAYVSIHKVTHSYIIFHACINACSYTYIHAHHHIHMHTLIYISIFACFCWNATKGAGLSLYEKSSSIDTRLIYPSSHVSSSLYILF